MCVNAFDQAVKMRLIADVPVGAFLSGGIDSTSVVASMALQSPQPIKTFSIGFEEPGSMSFRSPRALAKKYGTEHHEMIVRPDSVELVSQAGAALRRTVWGFVRHSHLSGLRVRGAAM